jgi:hypothetical protein
MHTDTETPGGARPMGERRLLQFLYKSVFIRVHQWLKGRFQAQ